MEYWETSRYKRLEQLTTDELLMIACRFRSNTVMHWSCIRILCFRGGDECFQKAAKLCYDTTPQIRRVGAEVLGEFGLPKYTHHKQCLLTLFHMLFNETNATTLGYVANYIAHPHWQFSEEVKCIEEMPNLLEKCRELSSHRSSIYRAAIACALQVFSNSKVIAEATDLLINMMTDHSGDVRASASDSLSCMIENSFPDFNENDEKICQTFIHNLDDINSQVRGDALLSLVNAGYHPIRDRLIHELLGGDCHRYTFLAARAIDDPSLYPVLKQIENDYDDMHLEFAIKEYEKSYSGHCIQDVR